MYDDTEDMPYLSVPVNENDHVQGPADAPVTLVEYGDFECSYCGMAYPIIKEAQRRMGNRLRFVFRNFPISTSHPHARHAAEAAEAAGAQGKFWEMHDMLYENQDRLDDEHLQQFAARIGLDTRRFNRDMSEHHFRSRVRDSFMSGVHSGVNGTPTFFINGERYDGRWDDGYLIEALAQMAGSPS
ncbi:MAG: thioredoxin domain-containing protein [Chloroflexota bacterium]